VKISVIVCTTDLARANKAKSIEEHYEQLLRDVTHEIVLVQNPQSMAAGYNEGIKRSNGDVLFFSHDDVEFLNERFVRNVADMLDFADVIGVAADISQNCLTSPELDPEGRCSGIATRCHELFNLCLMRDGDSPM